MKKKFNLKKFFLGIGVVVATTGTLSIISKLVDFEFEEEIVELDKVDFSEYKKVASIGGGQDGVIYNDYLFSFGGTGGCSVYSMEDYSKVGAFTLNSNDTTQPHSNSVCFGTEKYDKKDEFPLLYSNIYNNDSSKKGVTNVYRLTREDTTFTCELVQVIKIGFVSDITKWASGVRPYGNCVIDTDKNDYWAFVMDDLSNSTKFFKFDLPKLSDGTLDNSYGCNVVTLDYDDIKEQFTTEYFRYVQGACYHDGKIYSAEGFTNDTTNIPFIRVVNLEINKVEESINLVENFGLTIEPEMLDFYNNKLYYKDVNGNLYSFNLED